MKAASILETIGNTPHIRINRLFGDQAEVWIKSERSNPGASIKDRIALSMIEDAERSGKLKPDGVIVMHDCNPMSAAAAQFGYAPKKAAQSGIPGWTGEWTGDVYKAIMQLRAERSDLHTCVLDCDYGLGIVRRGTPDSTLKLSLDQIATMTYEEFASRRTELLNLRAPETFRASCAVPPPRWST